MTREFPTLSFCQSTMDGSIQPASGAADDARVASDFAIDTRVNGRYHLQKVLGSGGMGHVFLARDELLDRMVAIKVVAGAGDRPKGRLEAALVKEAKIGAILNHPGIATVYDFGFHAGSSYTVFEYIEGMTLRDVLERRGRLPLDEVREIVGALAPALDLVHSYGIVHRDLKPENICLTPDGLLKILDLGVARLAQGRVDGDTFSGTPAYAAPEQAACQPIDGRADQYALGLICYELLMGRRPFDHDRLAGLLQLQMEAEPPPLQCSDEDTPQRAEAERAVMRTLEKQPQKRFATCQEFADALGIAAPRKTDRQVLAVPQQQRINVLMCHAGQESRVARQLAGALARQGYSSWRYQQDALPGVSLAEQVDRALQRSEAVLLLISRSLLDSSEHAREIAQAHRGGRPFLPVTVDLSTEEFESYQPAWRSMLGAAAVIELDRSRIDDAAQRLVQALATLGVRPGAAASSPTVGLATRSSGPQPVLGQTWATDAIQINIGDLEQIVFRNETIDNFLHSRSKCFLSATKGLGKTLLLTYKRRLLTQSAAAAAGSVTLVPQGRPYLDFMSEMRSLSGKYEQPLSRLNTTKRLWSAALRMSLLSHHPGLVEEDEAFELEAFPKRIRRWIAGARVEPTVVFKELTSQPISETNRLIDDTENFLDQKLRMVHQGALIFIDKVDQAVSQLSRAAWVNVQAGLIEAAWDLMNANSHIRVFATIRHEAFVSYESDIKSNLYGATTILRYSPEELESVLDTLCRCYEGASSFKDFIGLNVIRHPRRPLLEDSFRYVHRHTLGRPRDFVAIASELAGSSQSLNESSYREIVNRTCSTALVLNIFEEMQVFLDCLQETATRLRFLSELRWNILSYDEALEANARFNGVSAASIREFGTESSDIFHPFRDLYITGLLGVVIRNPETGSMLQKFKQPDEMLTGDRWELPHSPFYLVHPALNGFISQHRTTDDYQVFQHVVVGEDRPWEPYDELFCQVERHLAGVTDSGLANAVHSLLKQARAALKSGKPQHLRAIFGAMRWRPIQQQLERSGHEDVVLWIDELAGR